MDGLENRHGVDGVERRHGVEGLRGDMGWMRLKW